MTKRFDGLTIVGGEQDEHYDDVERCEDANNSNLWGFLKPEEESFFEGADKIDMGEFDEGERQFLIIDKDNMKVYDMR